MGKIDTEKSRTMFTIVWAVIMVYSLVMDFFDFKLAILGFLVAISFGYLGFDIVMCKLLDKEKEGSY